MNYHTLDWDSDFFQFNVCRLDDRIKDVEDLREVESIMNENSFKLAYYSSAEKIYSTESKLLDIKLVDKKVTYVKKTSDKLEYHPSISSYPKGDPSSKMIDLAIQCGSYSRFKTDEAIGESNYERMYRLWLVKSTNREMAKEVLIYSIQQEIAGFLTIAEKNNRADPGLGAVDFKFRGKGLGRIIFQNAEKWAYDNGYKEIQLVTQGDNIQACRLYEKLGYTIESMEYFYHIWRK